MDNLEQSALDFESPGLWITLVYSLLPAAGVTLKSGAAIRCKLDAAKWTQIQVDTDPFLEQPCDRDTLR